MHKRFITRILLLWIVVVGSFSYAEEPPKTQKDEVTSVYVISLEGEISEAQLYILRRGLKQAVQHGVDAVVLKMDTPGGNVKTMLSMMEALENFKGETITFVDKEALSAGAYIAAATHEIYFHPKGVLGAAAVIQATGQEVSASLRQKIDSYLRARVRSYTQEYRYRAEVVRAMMDADFVLKIDDKIIKDKGELLTLTAQEAVKEYGNPPEKLFGTGIVESVEELLNMKYGVGAYKVKDFELTWSEEVAKWLNKITPILLGIGLLCLFIEFKTPGFGFFGISGIVLLLIVFASSYVAGLAGHEEILVFLLGIALLGLEIFIFPGSIVIGLLGLLMIFGSIVWALADIWPGEDFKFTFDLFIEPLTSVALGLLIAIAGIIIIGKYFFHSWVWSHLVLKSAVGGGSFVEQRTKEIKKGPNVGARGIVLTDLHPFGEVEIAGKRYQAKVDIGDIPKNAEIEVVSVDTFELIVKKVKK